MSYLGVSPCCACPPPPVGKAGKVGSGLGVKLKLEALEDRCTPATFWVNTTEDTPDANPGDGFAVDTKGFTSLRAAIQEGNKAKALVVVNFALTPGAQITLQSNLPNINQDFILQDLGHSGNDRVTVARDTFVGVPSFRLVAVNPGKFLQASNIIFKDGVAHDDGAGNVGVNVPKAGGAISFSQASLALYNCDFVANSSADLGGALYAKDPVNRPGSSFALRISNSKFVRNGTGGSGGAIMLDFSPGLQNSDISINTSLFANNGATDKGGAILMRGAEALGQPGPIISNEDINIEQTMFVDNLAGAGGAFASDGIHSLTFINSIFSENSSTNNGGALFVDNAKQGSIFIYGGSFLDNTSALGEGGGLYVKDDGNQNHKMLIQSTMFKGNSAKLDLPAWLGTAGGVCTTNSQFTAILPPGSQQIFVN
jgi:CSLREA domain-containing protein